ncbi:MAG: hypothetical protein JKX84_10390 [Flavobacteriales bacterium]|nr:hypothetical protein [Flavobacteriales bacterium]
MKTLKHIVPTLLAIAFIIPQAGCKKDSDIIYEVNDVNVNQPNADKNNVKSLTEFISIAHTDLFGSIISQTQLQTLAVPYSAFGDLKLIEDMIIKNFLNDQSVNIPTDTEMRANVDQFLLDAYGKFYNRLPNEFELWHMKNLISDNSEITPELVYYSLMTSNEYRYY